MPELPEVETVRTQLAPRILGRHVTDATAHESVKFASAIGAIGLTVGAMGRRGKFLIAPLHRGASAAPLHRGASAAPLHRGASAAPLHRGACAVPATTDTPGTDETVVAELVVHLGMTGSLAVRAEPSGDPYLRAQWWLDDGSVLEYRDVRRFGRTMVVAPGDYSTLPTLAAMGPEPWDPVLDDDGLWLRLKPTRRQVKTALLSQIPIAGVGNIYADEALWMAGINPSRRRITRAQSAALLEALRQVLAEAVDGGGTTLRDYRNAFDGEGNHQHRLACYGRYGQPCLRCGAVLRRRVIDARTTTVCPVCQAR